MGDEDQELIRRCAMGDNSAWGRLVGRYGGLVYAIGRRSGLDEASCDDVAQSVFAKLSRALPEMRDTAAVPGWISTTARREAWRVRRAQARSGGPAAGPEPEAAFGAAAEGAVDHQRLRDALAELGGRCRDLLHALYFRPVKPAYEELSLMLGLPIGSIGPTRQRCLAKLAALLGFDREGAE
ncbi:MAG: sigma-70 family RNA polymerase sigma factor [Phycisphaerales bacterium]|nr:sigma-70 family RNA polymerase sigma factor [Phycisphaerales bacterium]